MNQNTKVNKKIDDLKGEMIKKLDEVKETANKWLNH